MRILLADDEPSARSALRLLLSTELSQLEIEEVSSADEALACAEKMIPDIILLDWELPGRPIHWLLQGLRICCPFIVVIAMSSRPEARSEALIAGVNVFISKGDPPERLLAMVKIVEKTVSRYY